MCSRSYQARMPNYQTRRNVNTAYMQHPFSWHFFPSRLSDHYLNPGLLEAGPESFDDVIRGAITHRAGEADPHCTAEITNLLFKSRNQWGLDLLAMDIQRGRDHGIASYNDYR